MRQGFATKSRLQINSTTKQIAFQGLQGEKQFYQGKKHIFAHFRCNFEKGENLTRILIYDDEKEYREILKYKIEKTLGDNFETNYSTDCCDNLETLKEKLSANEADIVFLDIMMASENSIDWLIENKNIVSPVQFIIMTAFPIESYKISEIDSCYFLINPRMTDELLLNAVKRAIDNIAQKEQNQKVIKLGNKSKAVNVHDITYIETFNNNIIIHMISGEKHKIYSSLKAFANELPSQFLRCHKSYMVNMEHIVGYEPYKFSLEDESKVQISPKTFHKTINEYKKYLMNL